MIETPEKKLNKEQLEAIEFGEGPLLIIAGAGTGKTTVVTERIKYLVSSGKAKPAQILALTFTDKAAREMEERVDVAMPYGYTDMWISTFHSFSWPRSPKKRSKALMATGSSNFARLQLFSQWA